MFICSIMRASSQGGGFQVNSRLIPISTVTKVCGIFRNRALPSCSRRQPKVIVVAYIV